MTTRSTHAVLASSLLLAACAVDDAPTASPPAAREDPAPEVATQPLAWSPCDTRAWPEGFAPPAAGTACTTIEVPLDHARPDGEKIALRVARQTARVGSAGRAVFQLAGGPGGAAVWQTGTIPRLMPKLLDGFDLVYVDQRGAGGSGYLDCPGGYPETKADWVACGKAHAGDALAHFGTIDAAHDLDAVRRALGYTSIHVRGGSYGTRLGLELLRQHGEHVAAIVLDGVDPPDGTFFQDFIRARDRGIARLAAQCAASAPCRAVAPDVAGDLARYRAVVRKTPRAILVDGAPSREDEETFLQLLGGALFEARTYARIPRAIHAALEGDYAAWDALMSDVAGVDVREPPSGSPARVRGAADPSSAARELARAPAPLRAHRPSTRGPSYVAPGLYMTVLCSESLPNSGGLEALRALQDEQRWGGDPSMIAIAEACAAWKVPMLADGLRAPVISDARALLLGGALDLNTFPEWGAHAAQTLPRATNLLVPWASHSTMSVPCVGRVITDFLAADGDMSRVDTACLAAQPEPAW